MAATGGGLAGVLVLLWRDPVLRMATGLMILNGTLWASFGPFVALLAVQTFGLGDQGYAVVTAVATLAGVVASVWIGIRADQRASRRRMAIGTCTLALAGLALMTLAPASWSFALFHALLFPVATTIFGQVFTLIRLAAARYDEHDRRVIVATVRAAVSMPFVVILPLWSMALERGVTLVAIYPVAMVFAALMLFMVHRHWPRDDGARWADRPSGLSLRAALRELADAGLALRLGALGAIASMPALYVMTMALILTQVGGRPDSHPGLFFGLVAGAEVPSMVLASLIGRRVARLPLIVAAAALSAAFLTGLPLLAGSAWVWVLILPLALSHGVLLTVPITYLQDLLAERPGTGTSLLALQGLIGNTLAAMAFALGAWAWGYEAVTVLGAAMGLAGAGVLWMLDRGPARP